MAYGRKTNKEIKTTDRRMTPYDMKVAGTFAERPRRPKKIPRKPTAEENRANNTAMVKMAGSIGDLDRWAPMFVSDLNEMNRGKVGRPFLFSDSMIWWMTVFMTLNDSTFRSTAGLLSGFLNGYDLASPSYSRLQERSSELVADLSDMPEDGPTYLIHVNSDVSDRIRRLGIDSSGLNLSDTTLWRSKKWNTHPKDRGWLKIHALCDVDTGEIIAYAITDETIGDAPMLRTLVSAAERIGHLFNTVYADGAYSSDDNWKFLCRERNISFITSFRCDTVPNFNGCPARGKAAKLWCSVPYDEWTEISGYSVRWKCECVFSDLKAIFPETVTARTRLGIVRQLFFRVLLFNDYKSTRSEIMMITGNGIAVA